MAKNVLLILGHPSKKSFNKALLDASQKGSDCTGADCKTIYISDLNFDINLADGYKTGKADQLEEDLVAA
ncbi:MAG: flavodoxin family protein, partial [Ferruginibacter sp.]